MVLLWEIYHRGSNPWDRGLTAGYSAPIAPNFWCNCKAINPFTSVNMCTHFICDTFMLFKYEILSTVFRPFHFSWVMVMKSAAFDHLKYTCCLRWMDIDQENLMSLLHNFITCHLGFQSIWIKAQAPGSSVMVWPLINTDSSVTLARTSWNSDVHAAACLHQYLICTGKVMQRGSSRWPRKHSAHVRH